MKRINLFVTVFLTLLVISSGCLSFRDPSLGYIPQWRKHVDLLTTNEIPLPSTTPFDPTNALHKAYLEGYVEGINYAKRILGYGPIGVVVATQTENDLARFQGWKEGRYVAFLKINKIQEEIKAEAFQIYSNLNQEVGFHSNGRLWYLWQHQRDAGGSNVCISSTEWYENGKILATERYDHDGNPVGQKRRWYRNGKLQETETWRDGEMNGLCEGHYPNGQRMYSLTYRQSVPVGKARVWNEDGGLIAEGVFRDGEWKETFRVPGYIFGVPKDSFSVSIDPRGPVADRYRRFLKEAEGETNAVIEISNDEDSLMVLTGPSPTNGILYYLIRNGKSWRVDGKGTWEKKNGSYSFDTIHMRP
ncbi:MAG: hypothetical protein WC551_14550 [Patescibacteria group bacterium]